jgi:hypothetical protein
MCTPPVMDANPCCTTEPRHTTCPDALLYTHHTPGQTLPDCCACNAACYPRCAILRLPMSCLLPECAATALLY